MRKSTFALALAVLVALAWLMQGRQPRAAEDATPKIHKWEYQKQTLSYPNGDNAYGRLNEQGSDGWEVCGYAFDSHDNGIVIYKRPKQ
jgi:lipopolysaccharide export system protein LptC